jgi:hypothetical protein
MNLSDHFIDLTSRDPRVLQLALKLSTFSLEIRLVNTFRVT